ncbi:hypothetical protein ACA689_004201 [Vibrio vulnificus]|uniref:Uncharacterized protein n=1 Tax=Vibrio vulnificus TaxID=672 RepID=A0AAW4HIV5_VIBVL|nr:hypothetical protein [Vibrio vulnificus]ELA3118073.1 hypothetical protein [Vibrio vulnificus]ELV8768180.1 hypothetical protein [Vibrio vulnificus]MBN8124421.1 hypothetical protein [Vibrio vulnificus]
MEIIFQGPTFWLSEDEDKFFEWIYSLPNYKAITGCGLDLNLELSTPIEQSTVNQLFIIFKRWEIDFSPLKIFKELNNSHISWVNEYLS